MGKKDKKNKKNTSKPVETVPKVPVEENADVKEVLQLFNKLEEMVVDGDPRVKEALKQKPEIQNLLRDDSSLYGLSPRSLIGQSRPDLQPTIYKEGTNSSFHLQTQPMNQFSARSQHMPLQMKPPARSPRKNIIVPPIAIPEHSTLGDTFANGYHAAFVKQHPDGTLESMRMNYPDKNNTGREKITIPEVRSSQPRTLPQTQVTRPIDRRTLSYVTVPQEVNREKVVPVRKKSEENPNTSTFHSFAYETGNEQTNVSIHLPMYDDEVKDKWSRPQKMETTNSTNPPITEEKPYLSVENSFPISETLASTHTFPMPGEPLPNHSNTTTYNKVQQATVHSAVITDDGGTIECFGCRLQVPKNAVKKKVLLRLSILPISETPNKTDRIFNRSMQGEGSGTVTMAITPTISVSPSEIDFLKPITVQLPTCVAVHNENVQGHMQDQKNEEENNDIKAEHIVVKFRNSKTKHHWIEAETEVFRSSESVIFNTKDLGDMCGFYTEDVNDKKALSKRLAIYLFKSSDYRKKQFASMLISEELPHVIQRGVEGMPSWLAYTDSCSNFTLPEGKNLVLYIESLDPASCQTDAHKIDIPWENLWHPECIIRKHIHVNLMKKETPVSIQVLIDDGRSKLQADFLWKTKYQTILMPDLISVDNARNEYANGEKWEHDQMEQDLMKRVTWKPETPVSKHITNKDLLSYATM